MVLSASVVNELLRPDVAHFVYGSESRVLSDKRAPRLGWVALSRMLRDEQDRDLQMSLEADRAKEAAAAAQRARLKAEAEATAAEQQKQQVLSLATCWEHRSYRGWCTFPDELSPALGCYALLNKPHRFKHSFRGISVRYIAMHYRALVFTLGSLSEPRSHATVPGRPCVPAGEGFTVLGFLSVCLFLCS